jgi:pyruvate dehydrogenase E2 component (dihydrolipoamide acetyltransferase)
MRSAIARRMTESKTTVPHFYVAADVCLDAALELVRAENEASGPDERISVTAVLVRACAGALVANPAFNAVWADDGLIHAEAVNVGVAIALDEGLLAPAVLGADALTLRETSEAVRDLVGRARTAKLRPAELTEGTFTLSNLGMFRIAGFSAIVTPPQVAVLATARPSERVILRAGAPIATTAMTATLSADHRAVDGADAARFLETLQDALEQPAALRRPARETVPV